jgi:hypothetical protein
MLFAHIPAAWTQTVTLRMCEESCQKGGNMLEKRVYSAFPSKVGSEDTVVCCSSKPDLYIGVPHQAKTLFLVCPKHLTEDHACLQSRIRTWGSHPNDLVAPGLAIHEVCEVCAHTHANLAISSTIGVVWQWTVQRHQMRRTSQHQNVANVACWTLKCALPKASSGL